MISVTSKRYALGITQTNALGMRPPMPGTLLEKSKISGSDIRS